jgi:hypothetical protein
MSISRLPHLEQTSRSRQSGTGVFERRTAAISVNIADVICSAGSGSTWYRQSLHQTIRRTRAAAALPSVIGGPRRRGCGVISPAPATPGPPEQVDALEAPQRLDISPPRHFVLEADNSPDPAEPMPVPKPAEPKKAENCGHCGKPLPTLRSAGAEYCNRYCA